MNGREALIRLALANQIDVVQIPGRAATREELLTVHSAQYVNEVLDGHQCHEWDKQRPDLSDLAARFVGGTLVALDELMSGRTLTAVHLPGAKHHAQRDHSSGFCVFADFAIAAKMAAAEGKRVAILDTDAHHGDGTENLTFSDHDILTYSIHEDGIFPFTGYADIPALHVYNRPLAGYSGDRELIRAVKGFVAEADAFKPDLIFVAVGGDGHILDPLSTLEYTVHGMDAAMALVRDSFPTTPVLMGGAGGYRPDDATPAMWAKAAVALAPVANTTRV